MKADHALLTLSLLAASPLLGCQESPWLNEPAAAPDAQAGPPARVDLPAPVPLEGSLPPETHADGKMRVDGLLARREKYFGQKILVRGYVVEKYECPKDATRCQYPHAYLADTPAGGDKKLLLVNLDEETRDKLEVGQAYVVTGQFAQRSGEGFVSSTGLLIFDSIEGLEPAAEGKKP